MNELEIFTYTGRDVRTVSIDGEPWFVAADVADILGYRSAGDAVRSLDESEKGYAQLRTLGGEQQMLIVNESGLYGLIFRSRIDQAKAFRLWITGDVLPTIRKTGSYGSTSPAELTRAQILRIALAAEERRLELEDQNAKLAPKAESWDVLAAATGDYSVREAAQILVRDPGIDIGQNRLFTALSSLAWIDRKGMPYQNHVDAGRVCSRARSYEHPHTGEPTLGKPQVRITIKGLQELHRLLGGERPLQLPLEGVA